MEVAVLRRLQGVKQACKFLGCGRTDKVNFMAMSLLGPNLSELRKKQPQQRFSISTTMRLGIQILNAVQAIHQCGFIHRDLKPSNFAMGRQPEDCKTCYVLDFGLARQYTTVTGELRQPRPVAGFRGTVRYASVNAHFGHELGRHDDLWSVFYLMVELIAGTLPWKKIRNKEEAGEFKQGYDHKKLITGFPIEFKSYLDHIKNLTYYDKPNYSYLISLFEQALNRLRISRSDPFEWENEQSTPSGTSVSMVTIPFGSVDNPDMIIQQPSNLNLDEERCGRLSATDNKHATIDVPHAVKLSKSDSEPRKLQFFEHARNEEESPEQHHHSSEGHKRMLAMDAVDTNDDANEHPVNVNEQLNVQQKIKSPILRRLPIDPQDYTNEPQRAFQGLEDMVIDAANVLCHNETERNTMYQMFQNTKQLFVNVTSSSTSKSADVPSNDQHSSSSSECKIDKELAHLLLHPPTDPTKDAPFFVPQPPNTPPPPGYFCSSGRRRKFVKAGGTMATTSANGQQ